jgi:hypothetical protein
MLYGVTATTKTGRGSSSQALRSGVPALAARRESPAPTSRFVVGPVAPLTSRIRRSFCALVPVSWLAVRGTSERAFCRAGEQVRAPVEAAGSWRVRQVSRVLTRPNTRNSAVTGRRTA